MNFRIRYRHAAGAGEAEAIVEANSPAEALIKFRCTRSPWSARLSQEQIITSVQAAEQPDSPCW